MSTEGTEGKEPVVQTVDTDRYINEGFKKGLTLVEDLLQEMGYQKPSSAMKTTEWTKSVITNLNSKVKELSDKKVAEDDSSLLKGELESFKKKAEELETTLTKMRSELIQNEIMNQISSLDLEIPESTASKETYKKGIVNYLVAEINKLQPEIRNGKQYYFRDGIALINHATNEPLTAQDIVKNDYKAFLATSKEPQKGSGAKVEGEMKKAELDLPSSVKTIDQLYSYISDQGYAVNSPEFFETYKKLSEKLKNRKQ